MSIDCSSVKIIRLNKEQYDAIEKEAETVILVCKEDGRSIAFDKANYEVVKK